MRMLDTQVLVHMQSGRRPAPIQGAIASVAAKEFLIAYGNKSDRERYYPSPAMSWRHSPVALADAASRARHVTRRKSAERLIIDFPDQKETVIEFSNRTFAKIVNDRRPDAFDAAIAGLAREDQRGLRSRFSFLVEHSVQCFALEEQALAFGLDILAELLTSHAPKANFLNTLRDTLILGVAVKHGIPLQTEDKLLGKLAAARFGVNSFNEGEDIIVDFGTAASTFRPPRLESKGYIHRGWRIATDARPGAG